MKFHGVQLAEGSAITNATVASGGSFPDSPSEGELFYRNDGANEALYVYNGTAWLSTSAGGAASSGLTLVTVSGTSQTAQNGNLYVMTASNARSTLTLPSSPASGNTIGISNFTGRSDLLIARNNVNIIGLAEDLVLNVQYTPITLSYSGEALGWIIV